MEHWTNVNTKTEQKFPYKYSVHAWKPLNLEIAINAYRSRKLIFDFVFHNPKIAKPNQSHAVIKFTFFINKETGKDPAAIFRSAYRIAYRIGIYDSVWFIWLVKYFIVFQNTIKYETKIALIISQKFDYIVQCKCRNGKKLRVPVKSVQNRMFAAWAQNAKKDSNSSPKNEFNDNNK